VILLSDPGVALAPASRDAARQDARDDGRRDALYGYTYRAVSDADLAEYLAFNRSPLETRYNDAVMDAFTEALARASVGVGPLIEQGLQHQAA